MNFELSYNGLRSHENHETKSKITFGNLDPELFCACRGERSRALGNPGARIVSNWFQQKTIKVFLIGLFKFERERLNVRRVWRVSWFFPRHVEVNTAGRFLISAIPKQHLND